MPLGATTSRGGDRYEQDSNFLFPFRCMKTSIMMLSVPHPAPRNVAELGNREGFKNSLSRISRHKSYFLERKICVSVS